MFVGVVRVGSSVSGVTAWSRYGMEGDRAFGLGVGNRGMVVV